MLAGTVVADFVGDLVIAVAEDVVTGGIVGTAVGVGVVVIVVVDVDAVVMETRETGFLLPSLEDL
jgi:hypothetical protein